ncbi:MAG: hypothetical protein IJO72_02840 [Oscillospiraceae bacterium]|nr:hypothetical protein [Oscillospiraceae bacterium]
MTPVLHLHHYDDEDGCLMYDCYVYAKVGKVCEVLTAPLYITEITEDTITFHFEGDENKVVQLHPGETTKFVDELPCLIADGSGGMMETLTVTYVPKGKTDGLNVMLWEARDMKLVIREQFWLVDAPTRTTNLAKVPVVPGRVPDMGWGSMYFTIDSVTEDSAVVTVHYQNEQYNKTWTVTKGQGVYYRPVSMDGGYEYLINLEKGMFGL